MPLGIAYKNQISKSLITYKGKGYIYRTDFARAKPCLFFQTITVVLMILAMQHSCLWFVSSQNIRIITDTWEIGDVSGRASVHRKEVMITEGYTEQPAFLGKEAAQSI